MPADICCKDTEVLMPGGEMLPSYCVAMVEARTADEVLTVARSVLADITAYAECPGPAWDDRLAARRAAATWAGGEMVLALRNLATGPRASHTELDYFKFVIGAALARHVDESGATARLGDWAFGRLWETGSPTLPRYMRALAEAAGASRPDLPPRVRLAAAVVGAAEAALRPEQVVHLRQVPHAEPAPGALPSPRARARSAQVVVPTIRA